VGHRLVGQPVGHRLSAAEQGCQLHSLARLFMAADFWYVGGLLYVRGRPLLSLFDGVVLTMQQLLSQQHDLRVHMHISLLYAVCTPAQIIQGSQLYHWHMLVMTCCLMSYQAWCAVAAFAAVSDQFGCSLS
jgi:hypothetical protein